jgi:oxygen-independent coproporphyrinogen-3 oxidase
MLLGGYGLYLHVPFCVRRCAYCDFFSSGGKQRGIPSYARALVGELETVGEAGDSPPVGSVYFGGGTPSLLTPAQIGSILDAVRGSFRLASDAEISLEANPGTLDEKRLSGWLEAGVNRLSLGIQSLNDDELRLLGRIHAAEEAVRTCADARRAGYSNINLDLIFGLPGQTAADWERTIDRALEIAPEHFSLYCLSLERGTDLARAVRRGVLPAPDDDEAAGMYDLGEEKLAAMGYRHYEISNWAKDNPPDTSVSGDGGRAGAFPEFACRHNLRYWRNLPYLGFGAGAHGCAGGRRYANVRSVEKYAGRIREGRKRRFPLSSAAARSMIRSREEEMRETMWLGLRLTESGVDREEFRRRFGEDCGERFQKEIQSAVRSGLLEWTEENTSIRLTRRGRLLGNRVFLLFVAPDGERVPR